MRMLRPLGRRRSNDAWANSMLRAWSLCHGKRCRRSSSGILVPNARIRFHPAAAAEVEAAMQWYAERSPIAARAFATEVNTCVERVGEAPDRWPRYLRGTR